MVTFQVSHAPIFKNYLWYFTFVNSYLHKNKFLTLFINILHFISENETFLIQMQDDGCRQREKKCIINDFTNIDMNNKTKRKKNDFMFLRWVLYPTWLLCILIDTWLCILGYFIWYIFRQQKVNWMVSMRNYFSSKY